VPKPVFQTAPGLQISQETINAEPVTTVGLSAEDLAVISRPDYVIRNQFIDNRANCFVFTASEAADISSIHGSYQYLEKSAPLELVRLKQNVAVFVPRQQLSAYASDDYMSYGKYKLEIRYQLEGRPYVCRFEMEYPGNVLPELPRLPKLKITDW
jgi:hypothetical protein